MTVLTGTAGRPTSSRKGTTGVISRAPKPTVGELRVLDNGPGMVSPMATTSDEAQELQQRQERQGGLEGQDVDDDDDSDSSEVSDAPPFTPEQVPQPQLVDNVFR